MIFIRASIDGKITSDPSDFDKTISFDDTFVNRWPEKTLFSSSQPELLS